MIQPGLLLLGDVGLENFDVNSEALTACGIVSLAREAKTEANSALSNKAELEFLIKNWPEMSPSLQALLYVLAKPETDFATCAAVLRAKGLV